ncbi:MAG: carboxypeptidase M32, partial [Planctomycetaceae bacterium]|nr:carboxypeptidase M32 [Planctomycetaceae bacterium]
MSSLTDLTQLTEQLHAELRRQALLGSSAALLGWDEQTYMPRGGATHRSEQLSLLAGLSHEWMTAPRLGELISAIESHADCPPQDSAAGATVREARRKYDRSTKLPRRLVEELSRVTSLGQQAWITARKANDFSQFLPWLDQIVTLKREESQALGDGAAHPYDPLLDDYEPGMTTAEVEAAFTPLREALVSLVQEIAGSGHQPDVSVLRRSWPVDAQREFSTAAATKIGFCFENGRLDVAAHPFCSGIGPGDCRLTTRYDEYFFPGAFFGVLHEAGHGMYEQGLKAEAFGTAPGEFASLGIHESQSRMWENFVGRSLAFWEHFFPQARQTFPAALDDISLSTFHAAINDVRPSLIRVEADEVTYNLHIMLRFELEQALIGGDLAPADVPGAWNERFQASFGMTPPSDADGCLQDIHWSGGMLGYFPTYALGNMYAAQLFEAAGRELGDLDEQFRRGEFEPLLSWLQKEVHQRGRQYLAPQLIEKVTG